MWPFNRIKWEKLGAAWSGSGIENQFRALSTPPADIFRRDRDFRALPREDFSRLSWAAWTVTDYPEYKKEIFDCDDFAICYLAALKIAWAKKSRGCQALALGYIEGLIEYPDGWKRHAWAWTMDADGKIYFIEPQTGELMRQAVKEIYLVEI